MSTKLTEILTLESYLPYRLSILSNKISAMIARAYRDKFALAVNEWRIMAVLGEYPGISADEISIKIQIEKSIVSRALHRLLKRHLVLREIDDSDRRRQNLSLTKTGCDIYRQVVPVSYAYEDQLLECFSASERKSFERLIDKLYQHAEKIDQDEKGDK